MIDQVFCRAPFAAVQVKGLGCGNNSVGQVRTAGAAAAAAGACLLHTSPCAQARESTATAAAALVKSSAMESSQTPPDDLLEDIAYKFVYGAGVTALQ